MKIKYNKNRWKPFKCSGIRTYRIEFGFKAGKGVYICRLSVMAPGDLKKVKIETKVIFLFPVKFNTLVARFTKTHIYLHQ
jgi:hypothetical protein